MMNIDIQFNEQQLEKLLSIPLLLRTGPAERCLNAMSKPVMQRMRQLAPDSRQSGSRRKWSKAMASKTNWDLSTKDHIGMKTVKHNRGARIYIGYKHPKANKINFWGWRRGSRRQFLWGKDTGRVVNIPEPTWLKKAYDETRAQQEAAFTAQLTKELKELNLG